jgi:hypothetical protein
MTQTPLLTPVASPPPPFGISPSHTVLISQLAGVSVSPSIAKSSQLDQSNAALASVILHSSEGAPSTPRSHLSDDDTIAVRHRNRSSSALTLSQALAEAFPSSQSAASSPRTVRSSSDASKSAFIEWNPAPPLHSNPDLNLHSGSGAIADRADSCETATPPPSASAVTSATSAQQIFSDHHLSEASASISTSDISRADANVPGPSGFNASTNSIDSDDHWLGHS